MSFERELLKRIPRYESDGLIDRAAAGIAAIWCAVLANPYSRDAGVFDALFTCACFAAVGIHAFRNRAEPVRGQASRAIAAAIRG
ncbi:MAG: hypothetical protein SPF41_05790 [Candidatus Merdousia sp.]|nr:hypothetical protein [Candidatus Merdousia sp.]